MSQICDVHNNNQLDLIFNDLCEDFVVSRASHLLKYGSISHPSIEMNVTFNAQINNDDDDDGPSIDCFDFNKTNIPAIMSAMNAVDWSNELASNDIDAVVKHFDTIIWGLIREHVPLEKPRKQYSCPWMNRELASCRKRRNQAFKSYKRNPTHDNLNRFAQYRDYYLKLNATLYRCHLSSQAELIKSDPRKFWRLVKPRRSTGGIPRFMRYGEEVADETGKNTQSFASHFESLYSKDVVFRPIHGKRLHNSVV